jgi:hypothetical protein
VRSPRPALFLPPMLRPIVFTYSRVLASSLEGVSPVESRSPVITRGIGFLRLMFLMCIV